MEEKDKNGAGEEIQKKIKEEEKVQKPELKAEKPPKKMKTVVCKVMMLEGTEFPCEVEVRTITKPVTLELLYMCMPALPSSKLQLAPILITTFIIFINMTFLQMFSFTVIGAKVLYKHMFI